MKAPDKTQAPIVCDLILVGGGHAHIGVLRKLGAAPIPGVRLTLVTPQAWLDYSGMLPTTIAGHYPPERMRIDLRRLARFAGADFVAAEAIGLAPDEHQLRLANRPPLRYDLLALDTGVEAISVKSGSAVMAGIERIEQTHAAGAGTPVQLAIIGGGPAGVEVALSLAHRFRTRQIPANLTLVTASETLLPNHASAARKHLIRELIRAGVDRVTGRCVTRVARNHVVVDDGRRIAADMVFRATGARPPDWLSHSDLAVDVEGFVRVDTALRSLSHADVFAAGDIATLPDARPRSGVFAVRAASVLTDNLARAARGRPLRRCHLPRDGLALVSLGDRRALATRGRWSLAPGAGLWWLKHRLDTGFVRRFNDLPAHTGRFIAGAAKNSDGGPGPRNRRGSCAHRWRD